MNNYWVTNFNADQRGGHSWTYYLTTSSDNSSVFAAKFGWGCRIPHLTRIIPGSGTGDQNHEGSFVTGWPSNVILVSAEPSEDGKSLILHLREVSGQNASLDLKNGLTGKPLQATVVDPVGIPLPLSSPDIGPLESKFYRVAF